MGRTWHLLLRCYDCGGEFPVNGIAATEIGATADSIACPHCGAKADSATCFPHMPRRHLIVHLSHEDA
jgi:DNA-directed RNA polymerase subunit RPC12/RpoP